MRSTMKKIEKKLKERKPLTGVLLAALALSVLLAACPQPTDDPVDNPPVITDPNNPNNPDDPQNPVNTFVPVTGISGVPTGGVKGSPISLAVASAVPGNATNKTIVWSLKNEGITRMARSVDGNTYTPQQAGQATLTAVIANGLAVGQDFTRDFELVITDNHKPVTGITGVPQSGTLGTVIDLTGVTVEPADASDTGIAWSVAADSQVNGTLGGSGFIPESAGTLKLTATIAQGKSGTEAYTQTFTITIVIIPVTSITGVPLSGTDGEAIDLSGVTVEPANASSKAIVWSAPVGSGTWNTAGTAFTPNSSGNLQLTATVAQGKADGTAYTQTFTIAVASRYPQFYFQNTETDTSGTEFDLNAWTGEGTATQGWSISADEQPAVYFAVGKEAAAQTITVGGTHAALVTQATSGTVDGSAAGPELSVFTVDSSAFDLMFTGGSRAFTLTVAEEGKDSVTVNVTLTVTPEKTGAAVYRVTRSGERDLPAYANGDPAKAEAWATMGSLERIRGIKDYDVASHAFLEGAANDLTDALAWVDQNAQSDEEYLIRVEQSENILPTVCLSFAEQERVTLRLRGDGGERVLKHNLGNIAAANTLRDTTNLSIGTIQSFFILRGDLRNFDPTFNPGMDKDIRHNLHLETGISFDGQGASRSASYFTHLLELGTNCRLVMLAGSRIVNFSALSASGNNVPVMYVTHGENYDYSFYMYGGEITGNSVRANHESYAPVKFPSQPGGYDHSVFFKYGGSITGNFKFGTENSADKVCFGSTVSEGVNPIYLEPDTVYELPVITE